MGTPEQRSMSGMWSDPVVGRPETGFLGAGSVIHAMSDEQDMRKMGGIWKKIPFTYALMWIGSLALAGIPPFAGFYSKDIVLEAAWASHTSVGVFAYWMGIAAALMTAFYSWRLIIMTFHGAPRADHHTMEHVHESPAIMLTPLVVLAAGAIFAGMVFYEPFVGSGEQHEVAESAVEGEKIAVEVEHEVEGPVIEDEAHEEVMNRHAFWGQSIQVLPEHDSLEAAHHVPEWVKLMPLLAGLAGIGLGFLVYMFKKGIPAVMVRLFKPLHTLFFNKWFFDELYDKLFVKNAILLGRLFWFVGDQNTIDRIGPDGSAKATKNIATLMSKFQTGYVYQYAFVMMIAVIGLISWFVFRAGHGLE
jgi:NADH-quinone oxidoreductase subunit L